MLRKYYHYLLPILFFLPLPAFAKNKHKNTIKLYVSNVFYPELHSNSQIKKIIKETPILANNAWAQLGCSYERSINKKWGVGVGYNKWNNTQFFNPNGPDAPPPSMNFTHSEIRKGLWNRYGLKFIDLSASYVILNMKGNKVKLGVGISFQSGYSEYIDSTYNFYNPSFPHYEVYAHSEYKEYWGYVPSLSYDFIFLKGRVCIGTDLKARRYFNYGNYTQVDFGLHLGVSF